MFVTFRLDVILRFNKPFDLSSLTFKARTSEVWHDPPWSGDDRPSLTSRRTRQYYRMSTWRIDCRSIRRINGDTFLFRTRRDVRTGPAIVSAGPHLFWVRRAMTSDSNFSNKDELSTITVDKDVYRQLIQQFHESSIQRYGADSEQTRTLKLHLAAHAADAA